MKRHTFTEITEDGTLVVDTFHFNRIEKIVLKQGGREKIFVPLIGKEDIKKRREKLNKQIDKILLGLDEEVTQ